MFFFNDSFWKTASKQKDCSILDRLHGLFYLRSPYRYLAIASFLIDAPEPLRFIGRVLGRLLGKNGAGRKPGEAAEGVRASGNSYRIELQPEQNTFFSDGYHAKVMPLEAAKRLISIDRDVELSLPEKIIPYPLARDILLKSPVEITLMECPCRSLEKNPCEPLEVCMIVGNPFAAYVAERHPRRSRRIGLEEGLEVLEDANRRGFVHHAFFKDVMLGRFYAICNCCACCCKAIRAFGKGSPMLASSGYVCVIDKEKCVACGECARYCQFDALKVTDRGTELAYGRCMGCGVCASKCPREAISLVRAPDKGDPLEI